MFQPRDITYYIISLGCSKNLVDSEGINAGLHSAGFSAAQSVEEADLIIINTCGFIEPAKEESISVILDGAHQKEAGNADPHMKLFKEGGKIVLKEFGIKLVVTGCLSERYYEDIKKDIKEIDFLCGIPGKDFVLQLCKKFNIARHTEKSEPYNKPLIDGLSYSYIKISEGCSNNCSYCAIPLIRGPLKSYSPDVIMRNARDAAARGVKELIIIAQDIASYKWKNIRLPGLIERISGIDGVQWIRLLYCHPDHVTDEIIRTMRDNKVVVPYIDLPFQHASRTVLRSMGRKGDSRSYLGLIEKLRKEIPHIRIRSTFMVGYPGESGDDFKELLLFLKTAAIDRVGAFIFSPEEDTSACGLPGIVPEREKKNRYNRLMKFQRDISMKKLSALVGSEIDVLVEEKIDDMTCTGRTAFDAPEVDGIFYLTGKNIRINTIVRARITDAAEYDLMGEPV